MLASIFVVNGVRVLARPDAKVEAARPVTDRLTPMLERLDPRIPTDPRTLVRIKAATDVLAGAALATGHVTRPAAALLAAGLIPSTLVHNPKDGDFFKNLGLLGGLLLAAVDTEGRPGVGYRTSHAVDRSQRTVKRAMKTAKRDAKIAKAARRLPGRG
jgi:putative oxidoreductase